MVYEPGHYRFTDFLKVCSLLDPSCLPHRHHAGPESLAIVKRPIRDDVRCRNGRFAGLWPSERGSGITLALYAH
jgi:hypothetical protein